MSKTITFQLPIIEMQHLSGATLTCLAADMQTWFLQPSRALAQSFARAAKKALLQDGQYLELIKYLPAATPELSKIQIEVPPSKKRYDEQPHTLTLPTVNWHYPSGETLGTVPGLGLGYFARKNESLPDALRQAILLEFMRHKRLDNQRALIAAQWYKTPDIVHQAFEAEFYTPLELKSLAEGKEEKLLPKTASRMGRSPQQFIGLEKYLRDMLLNLRGEYRQSILILGPSGCGKTALVQAYEQKVGTDWQYKPWYTTASNIIQVLTEQGGWQYGLGQWVREVRERSDVVYIGNLAEWFEVGQYAGNSVSIAEALRDPLQRSEILLIGEVTEEQLEKIELRSPGYSQLFHIIRFSQRDQEEENHIAGSVVKSIAAYHNTSISDAAIARIIHLQRRYTPYSGYPGKTIRFFEALILQMKNHSRIEEADAIHAFCEESGMPRFLLDTAVTLRRENVNRFFKRRIIGQTAAIDEVVNALVTVKTGLAKSGKPIASLLFVGPTGVGKTQMAKTLAEYIFGDRQRMIRFDMSEYSDAWSVLRLTAANDASLVTRVRRQPFSVVLFDEIEKASHNFFDLLLQVLGEGRLTDDRGDVANFCSTIIIMTSNMGAQEYMKPSIGFADRAGNKGEIARHFEHTVTRHFRPELFNRLDRLVAFLPLSESERTAVLKKEVETLLQAPGIANRRLTLSIDETVWPWLGAMPIDFRYGARAIQRALKQRIVWPLAEVLSRYAYNDPLELTLSAKQHDPAGQNQATVAGTAAEYLDIQCRPLIGARKSLGFFAEFTDRVAKLRRNVQKLTEGTVWIGLLSELDRLEARRQKNREKFWSDPNSSLRYGKLTALIEARDKMLGNLYDLEKTCLTQLQEEVPEELWDDYQEMLSRYQTIFAELLFDIEATVNPVDNRLFIAIYGTAPHLDELTGHYRRWLEALGLACRRYNLYYIKNEEVAFRAEQQDQEDLALNEKTDSKWVELGKDGENVPHYYHWKSARFIENPGLQRIGVGLYTEAPCIVHFFRKEAGMVEFDRGENDKPRIYVDICAQPPDIYEILWGVHRRKFYDEKKVERRIKGENFLDSRYCADNTYLPLAEHWQRLRQNAIEYLETTLLIEN